jgi:hypothetical protein
VKRYEVYEYEDLCWPPHHRKDMREDAEGEYVLYADHLADRASLLATLRQAVEAMELAYEYAEVNTWETALLAPHAACREKLDSAEKEAKR